MLYISCVLSLPCHAAQLCLQTTSAPDLTCHCVCTPEHPLLWSLAQIPFLSSRSCTPMAMSLLVLLTAGDLLPTLAQVVPLPSFLLLLGIARLWSLPEQIALLRRHNSLYNFVMDCVYPALLQGIYCPGIGRAPSGIFCADKAATTLSAAVRRLLRVDAAASQPMAALLADAAGGPMAAWHLCNPDTPAWISLSGLLTDRRLHHQRHFEFYHLPGGSRCFVVHLLLDSFRFALLFESAPPGVVEID